MKNTLSLRDEVEVINGKFKGQKGTIIDLTAKRAIVQLYDPLGLPHIHEFEREDISLACLVAGIA